MKALSITQPWASLIAIHAKRYETRSWPTRYRGPIAIHATKGFPRDAQALCWQEPFASALLRGGIHGLEELPLGAIVAIAHLGACHRIGSAGGYLRLDRNHLADELSFGNFAPGRFAWELANVVRLPEPIPFLGALGLWDVPAEIETQIHQAVQ